jgi:hypothetical protein
MDDHDDRTAFIISAFNHEDTDLLYTNVLEPICTQLGLTPIKVDIHEQGDSITNEIFNGIRKATIILADLTYERPNCYAEVGYTLGLDKHRNLILLARADHDPRNTNKPSHESMKVHFDLDSHSILYWESDKFSELQQDLYEKIEYRLAKLTGQIPSPDSGSSVISETKLDNEWINNQELRYCSIAGSSERLMGFSCSAGGRLDINIDLLKELPRRISRQRLGIPTGEFRYSDSVQLQYHPDAISAYITHGAGLHNYWIIRRNGDFCSINSMPDFQFFNGTIDGIMRIYYFYDTLQYGLRLYSALQLTEGQPFYLSYHFKGLEDAVINDKNMSFHISHYYRCSTNNFTLPYSDCLLTSISQLQSNMIEVCEKLGKDFFYLFGGLEVPVSTYANLLDSYNSGRSVY